MKTYTGRFAISAAIWLLITSLAIPTRAQQPQDLIVHNAKIITVDDDSFTSRLGTIAEAMHIRDGKIAQVGTNAEIRGAAGPETEEMDLGGRTVLPGLILTHEHPWDWNPVEPPVLRAVLNDDTVVVRALEGSPTENAAAFPEVLTEAVHTARPGQWIYIVFTYGPHYEYAPWGTGRFGRVGFDPQYFDPVGEGRYMTAEGAITKEQLDAAAPDNPVVLRDVFVSILMNQRAAEESRQVFSQPDVNPEDQSSGRAANFRWMFQNVVMRDFYPQLVELMRLGLEWWAGYGMTSFASNAYDPMNVKVYSELDRRGEMPVREMWSWNWRRSTFLSDPFFVHTIVNQTGRGSDYFWLGGASLMLGGRCVSAEPLASSALGQAGALEILKEAGRSDCSYVPGTPAARLLYEYIKAGGRYVNHHAIGDRDVDSIMTVILQASRDAGMTDEEIRAKRHTFDHSVLFPRPDQVEPMQRLGIMTSGTPFEVHLGSPAVFDLYGERVTSWVVPKKRLVEAQIYNTLELDHAIGSTDLTVFSALSWLITRRAWDGKVYGMDQAIDRETALKISTTWGSRYLVREEVLGSLEAGKWADFIVLDRDYLTIPQEDIENIRVLMTVVGGNTVHLVPSLAREIGREPAGAQVRLGGAPAQW